VNQLETIASRGNLLRVGDSPKSKAQQIYAALCALPGKPWPKPESDFARAVIACLEKELAGEPKVRKSVGISNELDDAAWILSLEKEPSLSGVNIRLEISKCDFWCRNNKKQRTRRRILNWLTKAERVVDARALGGTFANGLRPQPPAPPEPPHWREVFPDYIYAHLPWNQIERSAQIYLSEQMAQRMKQA
jgi:hypothetical protein